MSKTACSEPTQHGSAAEPPEKSLIPCIRQLRVSQTIKCLFFGRRGVCLTVSPSNSQRYSVDSVGCVKLEEELAEVRDVLNIGAGGEICLINGIYIHVYEHPVACSELKLETAKYFFQFSVAVEDVPYSSSLDVDSFHYTNDDLIRRQSGQSSEAHQLDLTEKKYAWTGDQMLAWSWNELTWITRLFYSIQGTKTFDGVNLYPAFEWRATTYQQEIGNLFPNVPSSQISPFHGVTDILMICNKVGVARVSDVEEVPTTCEIHVGGFRKVWPQKLGEVLASMHFFGTLHYINNLNNVPEDIAFTVYGMLVIRTIGFIIVKMVVNGDGCSVFLVQEGHSLALANGLEFLANTLKE